MTIRISGLIAGGIAAGIGLGLLASTPALAAPMNPSVTVTVRAPGYSHTSPSQNSTKINAFYPGDRVDAVCQVRGEYLNGSNTWLRLTNKGTGYISQSVVQAPTLPAC